MFIEYDAILFSSDAVAFSNAHFGVGIGSTFLDEVICSGSESSLLDCTRASSVTCSYGHQEDAGVRCYSKLGYSTANVWRVTYFITCKTLMKS